MELYKREGNYAFLAIAPGNYYIPSYAVQTRWGGCLNSAAPKFTVPEDTVLYLGEIDVLANSIELQNRIKEAGDEKIKVGNSQSGIVRYYGEP